MTDLILATRSIEDVRVTSISPLSRLSYWQYIRLRKCILSGLFPKNTTLSLSSNQFSSYSRQQILGLAFHRILDVIDKYTKEYGPPATKAISTISSNTIQELEQELIKKTGDLRYRGISEWSETGHILNTVDTIQRSKSSSTKRRNHESGTQVISERVLVSENGRIAGKPDLIIRRNDWIGLIDYKLSKVDTIQDEVISTYEDQLLLYAQLIEETFGNYPNDAWLIGKDAERRTMTLDRKASLQIRHDMEAFLDHANRQIAKAEDMHETLATPSSDACAFCDAKPWCPSLRKNASTLTLPKHKQFVFGIQVGPLRETRRAGDELSIRPVFTSMNQKADVITITRLNKQWFPRFRDAPGKATLATNLIGSDASSAAMTGFESQIVTIGGDC